jgi:hypothetical protein
MMITIYIFVGFGLFFVSPKFPYSHIHTHAHIQAGLAIWKYKKQGKHHHRQQPNKLIIYTSCYLMCHVCDSVMHSAPSFLSLPTRTGHRRTMVSTSRSNRLERVYKPYGYVVGGHHPSRDYVWIPLSSDRFHLLLLIKGQITLVFKYFLLCMYVSYIYIYIYIWWCLPCFFNFFR